MSYPDPRYGSTPLEQTVTSATSDTPRATDSGEEPQSTDGVRRRQQLTFADKKHVCEIARANPNLAHLQIGKIFGVERSTISRTLRESQYWLTRDAQTGSHLTRRRKPDHEALEAELVSWLRAQPDRGGRLLDADIRRKAQLLASGFSESREFKASGSWLRRFKVRHDFNRGLPMVRASERSIGLTETDYADESDEEDEEEAYFAYPNPQYPHPTQPMYSNTLRSADWGSTQAPSPSGAAPLPASASGSSRHAAGFSGRVAGYVDASGTYARTTSFSGRFSGYIDQSTGAARTVVPGSHRRGDPRSAPHASVGRPT